MLDTALGFGGDRALQKNDAIHCPATILTKNQKRCSNNHH